MNPDRPRLPSATWRAILVACLVVAAVATGLTLVALSSRAERAEPWRVAAYQLVTWGWWAVAVPVIGAVLRRAPLAGITARRAWWGAIGRHAAAALGLAAIHAVAIGAVVVRTALAPAARDETLVTALSYLLSQWPVELLGYAAVAGAWHAASLVGTLRDREANAARLEARLARAQLQALTVQLQPHFLFNTLQGIATLVDEEPEAARLLLHRLADLLRSVLDAAATPEVPLEREVAIIERYLDIERTRIPDRLRVTVTVADAARDALVPVLLLQPLVENAIRHAVAPRVAPTHVVIGADTDGAIVTIRVRDDGDGFDPAQRHGTGGMGLANTAARLEQAHGSAARLTVESRPGEGITVTVTLPYVAAPAASLDAAHGGRPIGRTSAGRTIGAAP